LIDPVPTSFEREVERNFRWNFAVNLADISFIMLGISLVSRETVLPLLVSNLTDSTVMIGLVVAIYSLGLYLPQLVGAGFAEAMPRKKPFLALVGGLGERVPYLLAGIAVLLFAEEAPGIALAALVVCFGLSGAAAGFATPAWFDMISKVIPVQRRGLFTGIGFGLGALMGVAGAAVIGVVLERLPFPQNFSLLFGLAFVAMAISWLGLVLNREPASPLVHERMSIRDYTRRLPVILRQDGNFTRYVVAMTVSRGGTMAGGFFTVYAVQRFELGGAEIGLLTGVLIGAQAVLNPLWGVLADRRGHKVVLLGGSLALALAGIVAALAPSWLWLLAAFVLLSAFLAADSVSFLTIIPEFCKDEDRPTYIGLANTLLSPASSLAPLAGGWLAALLGFPPMFALAAAFALAAGLLLLVWVHEPRNVAARLGAAVEGV
jgi:MFS family permease